MSNASLPPERSYTQLLVDFATIEYSTDSFQPLSSAQVLGSLAVLESVGAEAVGAQQQLPADFARDMQRVYTQAVELNVQPPFTDQEKTMLSGRYAIYAQMTEMAEPKRRFGRRKPKPTDTARIPTDEVKK